MKTLHFLSHLVVMIMEILKKILKLERGTVFNINNLAALTKQ